MVILITDNCITEETMPFPHRFRIRKNRILQEKRIELRSVLKHIAELMEKQYVHFKLYIHLDIDKSLPKFLAVNESQFYYLFFYLIELLIYDLKVEGAITIQVQRLSDSSTKKVCFGLFGEGQNGQFDHNSTLLKALYRMMQENVQKSFSFELANDLASALNSQLWIEYSNDMAPFIQFHL